jgi:hypothetical protein
MLKRGKKRISIPVLPIALLVGILIMVYPVMYFVEHPDYLLVPTTVDEGGVVTIEDVNDPEPQFTLLMSMLGIFGVGAAFSIFFIFSNIQRSRVESSIYKMESEFELALFQLGNRISGGTPLEIAVEKATHDVKDLEIANLFNITIRNMRTFGMTFENALTHPQTGALRYYPSSLIQNVMQAITKTSQKGVQFASQSMLTVSRYLKSVRETQEYMRGILSETTSSMQFQAYAMAPLITGLIVAMSQVILQVLSFLGTRLESVGFTDTFGINAGEILGSSSSITSPMFQLIVGVYLLQVIIILAMFVTKINRGEDSTSQWFLAGKMIIIALTVYALVSVGSTMMFGEMIEGAMSTMVSGT